MKLDKEKAKWLKKFKDEYKRRVGITMEDGGLDAEDVYRIYGDGTPQKAVDDQIERYDLDDVTESAFGWK